MTRLLIVDDDPQICRLIERVLQHDYSCASASNATEARELLKDGAFELALIDVSLPGESGLDLLSYIRSQYPGVAPLIVTAIDDREIAETVLEIGAYGYIVKPFKPTEFQINVNNALRRHRLEIESLNYQHRLEETVQERTRELVAAIGQLQRAEQEVRWSREETIHRLAKAVESRSAETGMHIERMSQYSGYLARIAGLDAERCELIQTASAMHDIGKIGTPDDILHKPAKLTEAEFEIIKEHADIGHKIFAGSSAELLVLAATIAWTHHERWDGTGYPQGLVGDDIPLEGRIASIADVFDALMSRRVYKQPYSLDRTIELMREGRGTQFDPGLLDLFLESPAELMRVRSRFPDVDVLSVAGSA